MTQFLENIRYYENCPLIQADEAKADFAERHGDLEYAKQVRKETFERFLNCLGTVSCNDRIECGVIHETSNN